MPELIWKHVLDEQPEENSTIVYLNPNQIYDLYPYIRIMKFSTAHFCRIEHFPESLSWKEYVAMCKKWSFGIFPEASEFFWVYLKDFPIPERIIPSKN